jgi:hypothetical protein
MMPFQYREHAASAEVPFASVYAIKREDGGMKFLRNTDTIYLPNHMASYFRFYTPNRYGSEKIKFLNLVLIGSKPFMLE